MTDKTLAARLRDCGNDPMWADHAEVPKAWCLEAADALNRLSAPEAGAGVTLETTAEDRQRLRDQACLTNVSGTHIHAGVRRLLRDHDTLTAAILTSETARFAAVEARREAEVALAAERERRERAEAKAEEEEGWATLRFEELKRAEAEIATLRAAVASIKSRAAQAFEDADGLPDHLGPDYEIVLTGIVAVVDAALATPPAVEGT